MKKQANAGDASFGSQPVEEKASNPNDIKLVKSIGESEAQALAHAVVRPVVNSAVIIKTYATQVYGVTDINSLISELAGQVKAVNINDLSRADAMLICQATTLDTLFTVLLQRASKAMDLTPEHAEALFRLGFRAQSQCRSTLETLGFLKAPKSVAFVRQMNAANGPMQVNNKSSRTRKNKRQNKLLDGAHEKRLELRTSDSTIGGNSAVEAMGAKHRPSNNIGKKNCRAERI